MAEIQEEQFIQDLKAELLDPVDPDLTLPLDVRALVGYVANAKLGSDWKRVYLTLGLDEFVELREDDIVSSVGLASDGNPLGGQLLWIKKSANLWHVRLTTAGDFLKGDLTSRFMDSASAIRPETTPDVVGSGPSVHRPC
jgi:hypothetical protein